MNDLIPNQDKRKTNKIKNTAVSIAPQVPGDYYEHLTPLRSIAFKQIKQNLLVPIRIKEVDIIHGGGLSEKFGPGCSGKRTIYKHMDMRTLWGMANETPRVKARDPLSNLLS